MPIVLQKTSNEKHSKVHSIIVCPLNSKEYGIGYFSID